MTIQPPTFSVLFDVTNSPETGLDVPLVVSWWSHPTPDHPQVARNAQAVRGFIRHCGMDEHMAHFLVDADGERTVLELAGEQARLLFHPLAAEIGEFPVPDPLPEAIGNAAVNGGGMGVYVLVAVPLAGPPSLDDLRRLPDGDYGTARIEVRFDQVAQRRYAETPVERALRMVDEAEDPGLKAPLRFALGLPPEGSPWE